MTGDALGREKLQRIREWLGKAFEGYKIEDRDVSLSAAAAFEIESGALSYCLEVDHAFLASHTADDLPRVLDRLHVRDELCRAEGMPLILTNRGVRLVSSN